MLSEGQKTSKRKVRFAVAERIEPPSELAIYVFSCARWPFLLGDH